MPRRPRKRPPVVASVLVLLLAAALMLAAGVGAGAAGAAQPKLHECQHPTTTGEEAFNLHNVNVHVACRFVRELGRWLPKDHHTAHLYGCDRPAPDMAGTPVLRLHHFFGWKLKIAKSGLFVAYRKHSSFAVGGTDFPLNCT